MRFWDASALVPLVVRQGMTSAMRALYRSDPGVFAWWGSFVECESALARLERTQLMARRAGQAARGRLERFAATWEEVVPTDGLREQARRLLRVHDLRAADALQLSAGLAAAEGRPATLEFVCLDDRLAAAAEREGFRVRGRPD